MKDTLTYIGNTLMLAVMADLFILSFALMQILAEGQTGYWSPFWKWQVEIIISVLG